MIYNIDVLNKVVSPLYQVSDGAELETKNFNLFIYANEIYARNNTIVYPKYD